MAKKKVITANSIEEAENTPEIEQVNEPEKVDAYAEIHAKVAEIDAFYEDLAKKKRETIQPDFLNISNFDNRKQSGEHFQMHLNLFRKYLEE